MRLQIGSDSFYLPFHVFLMSFEFFLLLPPQDQFCFYTCVNKHIDKPALNALLNMNLMPSTSFKLNAEAHSRGQRSQAWSKSLECFPVGRTEQKQGNQTEDEWPNSRWVRSRTTWVTWGILWFRAAVYVCAAGSNICRQLEGIQGEDVTPEVRLAQGWLVYSLLMYWSYRIIVNAAPASCQLSTCALVNLGQTLQSGGDEVAGQSSTHPFGHGKWSSWLLTTSASVTSPCPTQNQIPLIYSRWSFVH